MDSHSLIKGELVQLAWREAHQYGGLDNQIAVMMVIRNRVRAGWHSGDWLQVLQNHSLYEAHTPTTPVHEYPDVRDPIFLRLLQLVDGVYDGSMQDVLTTSPKPAMGEARGGLFYADQNNITREWFLENISRNPVSHPRTSQVGQVIFFG